MPAAVEARDVAAAATAAAPAADATLAASAPAVDAVPVVAPPAAVGTVSAVAAPVAPVAPVASSATKDEAAAPSAAASSGAAPPTAAPRTEALPSTHGTDASAAVDLATPPRVGSLLPFALLSTGHGRLIQDHGALSGGSINVEIATHDELTKLQLLFCREDGQPASLPPVLRFSVQDNGDVVCDPPLCLQCMTAQLEAEHRSRTHFDNKPVHVRLLGPHQMPPLETSTLTTGVGASSSRRRSRRNPDKVASVFCSSSTPAGLVMYQARQQFDLPEGDGRQRLFLNGTPLRSNLDLAAAGVLAGSVLHLGEPLPGDVVDDADVISLVDGGGVKDRAPERGFRDTILAGL